jgi:hypothetical protein
LEVEQVHQEMEVPLLDLFEILMKDFCSELSGENLVVEVAGARWNHVAEVAGASSLSS